MAAWIFNKALFEALGIESNIQLRAENLPIGQLKHAKLLWAGKQ